MGDLSALLYEGGYFSFEETSRRYVGELYNEIVATLPQRSHRSAPKYFDRYGKNLEYAVFKKSRHTSWYAFFRVYWKNGEEIYQVRHIANNHTIAHHL